MSLDIRWITRNIQKLESLDSKESMSRALCSAILTRLSSDIQSPFIDQGSRVHQRESFDAFGRSSVAQMRASREALVTLRCV